MHPCNQCSCWKNVAFTASDDGKYFKVVQISALKDITESKE
jgi:hypothetical protein